MHENANEKIVCKMAAILFCPGGDELKTFIMKIHVAVFLHISTICQHILK